MNTENLHRLSGGAARLLLTYIFYGNVPKKELMERSGITDSGNFFRYRKELLTILGYTGSPSLFSSAVLEGGSATPLLLTYLISNYIGTRMDQPVEPNGKMGSVNVTPIQLMSSVNTTPDDLFTPQTGVNITLPSVNTTSVHNGYSVNITPDESVTCPGGVNTTSVRDGSSVIFTPDEPVTSQTGVNTTSIHNGPSVHITPDVNTTSIHNGSSVNTTSVHDGPSVHMTLLDRIEDADAMESSGDPLSRNSPFQIRRKKQIELLKEMWTFFFPEQAYPLTDTAAKDLLAMCDNTVAFIYGQAEEITQKKKGTLTAPLGYLKKALPNQWALHKKSLAASSPVFSSAGPVYGQGELGELRKPTPEEQQQIAKWRQRAKNAKPELFISDDDE